MLNKTKAALQGRSSNTTKRTQYTNMLVVQSQGDKRDPVNSGKHDYPVSMLPDNFGLPNTISTPKYFGIAYRGKAAPKFLGRAQGAKKHLGYNPLYSKQSLKLSRIQSPKYLGQSLGSMPNLRSFSRQASFTHALKLPLPVTDSISFNKVSSKRMFFMVLPERSNLCLELFSCIGRYHRCKLNLDGTYHRLRKQLKTAKPGSVGTLTGLLTTNDNLSIEVAMYKYTFLIGKGKARLSDINPIRLITVLAQSESEARFLAGNSCLIFAGRLPAQEVSHD